MHEHDRGSYRDARRRQAKEAAEAYKDGKAEEMFFGASPTERKDLRKTKDRRSVDVDKLNLDSLDRGQFHAPDKVGENLRLIDMAMGNEPDAPTKPVPHPAGPKQAPAQPRAKRKPKKPRRRRSSASSGRRSLMDSVARVPSWFRREQPARDDFRPAPADSDEGVVVAAPRGRWLERLLWLAAVALGGAGAASLWPAYTWPGAPVAFPDGLQPLLQSQTGLVGLALVCAWLALDLRLLRQPRGGLLSELARAIVLAGVPALLAAGLVAGAGVTPDPGLAPPGVLEALAPVRPHAEGYGVPLYAAAGAAALLPALLLALIVRARAPKL